MWSWLLGWPPLLWMFNICRWGQTVKPFHHWTSKTCRIWSWIFTYIQWKKNCLPKIVIVTVPIVCLNGQKLKWDANVKNVGNIITSTLDDKDDIELKIPEYLCQVNKLLSDFQGLRHDVLSDLFNKYCNSFYGSQAWELRSKHV